MKEKMTSDTRPPPIESYSHVLLSSYLLDTSVMKKVTDLTTGVRAVSLLFGSYDLIPAL